MHYYLDARFNQSDGSREKVAEVGETPPDAFFKRNQRYSRPQKSDSSIALYGPASRKPSRSKLSRSFRFFLALLPGFSQVDAPPCNFGCATRAAVTALDQSRISNKILIFHPASKPQVYNHRVLCVFFSCFSPVPCFIYACRKSRCSAARTSRARS